jgi:uncharacterized protein YcfJ
MIELESSHAIHGRGRQNATSSGAVMFGGLLGQEIKAVSKDDQCSVVSTCNGPVYAEKIIPRGPTKPA